MILIDANLFQIKDWNSISAIAAVIASLAAVVAANATVKYTAYTRKILDGNNIILEKNNKLAEYKIYIDFDKKLSESETLKLIDACKNNTIMVDVPTNIITNMVNYSGDKLKRGLLDILEDLSKFYQDGLISIESVDTGFGYIVLYVGNNSEVRKFIKDLRKYSPNLYIGIEILYLKILQFNNEEFRKKYNQNPF